jgi:hypothetical protein
MEFPLARSTGMVSDTPLEGEEISEEISGQISEEISGQISEEISGQILQTQISRRFLPKRRASID